MIIRTYTDEGELINEHKISDINNYAEFYNMLYVNILRKFDDKQVIKLCVDLLRRVLIEPTINSEYRNKMEE